MINDIKKPKIAFVIDTLGWTFDNIAINLKEELKEYYDIDIIPGDIFNGNMIKLFILCKNYDLIHFFWRGYFYLIEKLQLNKYIESIGFEEQEFIDEYILNKNITMTVCDHLFLNEAEYNITQTVFKYCKKYFVTSEKLKDTYINIEEFPNPITKIYDGVDLDIYKPINLERFNNIDNLIVGWVGNSKYKDSDKDDDLKGVNGIIKPAIQELQQEGYKIELKLADSVIEKIPQSEMPQYYSSLHLYVCASKTEGTPLPIIESMACRGACNIYRCRNCKRST